MSSVFSFGNYPMNGQTCSQCKQRIYGKSFESHRAQDCAKNIEIQKQIHQSMVNNLTYLGKKNQQFLQRRQIQIQLQKEEKARQRARNLQERKKNQLEEEDEKCPICFQVFQTEGNPQDLETICSNGHFLHIGCLKQCIGAGKIRCPVCREAADPDRLKRMREY